MFDLASLQYNSENPTLTAIIFTVICALMLGIIMAFTYDKTSKRKDRPDHFLQAMVLITIVAATIMQAIGDSVARGLGMLGALSIIRFRTTIKDPRNLVFMFGAIAAGIACGVFGFVIAIMGTLGFCLTAFILRFSSFHQKEKLEGSLNIEVGNGFEDFSAIDALLKQHCDSYHLDRYKVFTNKKLGMYLYEYKLKLRSNQQGGALLKALNAIEGIKVVQLVFRNKEIDVI